MNGCARTRGQVVSSLEFREPRSCRIESLSGAWRRGPRGLRSRSRRGQVAGATVAPKALLALKPARVPAQARILHDARIRVQARIAALGLKRRSRFTGGVGSECREAAPAQARDAAPTGPGAHAANSAAPSAPPNHSHPHARNPATHVKWVQGDAPQGRRRLHRLRKPLHLPPEHRRKKTRTSTSSWTSVASSGA